MESKQKLSELIDSTAKALELLQYAPQTITVFRLECRKFTDFVYAVVGEDIFTEQIGSKYLKEKFDFPPEKMGGSIPARTAEAVRCIRKLGEYHLYGSFVNPRKPRIKNERDWIKQDQEIISAFLEAIQTKDNTDETKRAREHRIKLFYEFLGLRSVNGIGEMTAQIISDYAKSLQGGSLTYAKHRLVTLRFYFRFLYENGYCHQDWSYAVPRLMNPKNLNVPALWTVGELEHLLKSIDRGSPNGKRAYAVILLVAQLGLRISDVANLKLDNLRWERNEIELIQCKTGKKAVYPMLGDVGWAIIDYIRHARPDVGESFVFITCNAPYTKLHPTSVGGILKRQMRCCGIQKKPGTVNGMHSLRHTLARRLLEHGTPLPMVANIMGHTSYLSTSPYLKIDITGLRECALSIKEAFDNA